MDSSGTDPREAASRTIARSLREMIRADGFEPGSRLPSERSLATKFGVGRNTIRDAMRHLTVDGLVWQRHGSGTYVRHSFLTEPQQGSPRITSAELSNVELEAIAHLNGQSEVMLAGLLFRQISQAPLLLPTLEIFWGDREISLCWNEGTPLAEVIDLVLPRENSATPIEFHGIPGLRLATHALSDDTVEHALFIWLARDGYGIKLFRSSSHPPKLPHLLDILESEIGTAKAAVKATDDDFAAVFEQSDPDEWKRR